MYHFHGNKFDVNQINSIISGQSRIRLVISNAYQQKSKLLVGKQGKPVNRSDRAMYKAKEQAGTEFA
jgi:hypothetical protein